LFEEKRKHPEINCCLRLCMVHYVLSHRWIDNVSLVINIKTSHNNYRQRYSSNYRRE